MSGAEIYTRKLRRLMQDFSTAALKRIAKPRYGWRSTVPFDGARACLIGQAIPDPDGSRDEYESFKRSCPGVKRPSQVWASFDKAVLFTPGDRDGAAEVVGKLMSKYAANVLAKRGAA